MAKEKVNLYLLAIVAIVAVVGIVVLILNTGTTALSVSDDDLSGQVAKMSPVQKRSSEDEIGCSAGHCRCNGVCLPYDIYGRCGC